MADPACGKSIRLKDNLRFQAPLPAQQAQPCQPRTEEQDRRGEGNGFKLVYLPGIGCTAPSFLDKSFS